MLKHNIHTVYLLPTTLLTLTATTATLLSPPSTHATDPTSVEDTVRVVVDSSCGMSQTVLSSGTTMNPGEYGTIGSSRIAAYCNDSNGYDIYAIGYTNGEYGNTNMKSTTTTTTIPTGTSGDTSYWNMTLSPGTATSSPSYIPAIVSPFATPTTIPTDYTKVATYPSSTAPQDTDPLASGSYFTSTYSSHISTTQPAGVYTGAVQYVMVHPHGAPAPEKPLYIQDTTSVKNKLTKIGDTTQAIDKRDGKKYWIAKLADGNIWMTQNLDLDLNSNTMLTPADTDISANWTPANSTIEFTGTTMDGWNNNYNTPYSADPNELYIYSSGTTKDDKQYTSLADCQAAYPDCSMKNHAGNYYNWSAAVANNDTSSMASGYNNAPHSICPAGWKLPSGRDSSDTASSREWNALLYAEGVAYSPTGNGYATNGFNKIRKAPLWLVRAGYVSSGSLAHATGDGFYWSSTFYNDNLACYLEFYPLSLAPVITAGRYQGHSVRCVAR